jgi:uncharacterized protein (TIGR02453 family)
MLSKSTLDFLSELKINNNKFWFDENKKSYQAAKSDFEKLVENLIDGLNKIDPMILKSNLSPKGCMFRINRDVRFSNDKSPYKTNMGAAFNFGGKKTQSAAYYFHCEPNQNAFIAGGLWMPESSVLKSIRQEIDYNFEDFKKMMNEKKMKSFFPEGPDQESVLKRAPQGYEEVNPAIEFLKLKSFTLSHKIDDEILLSKELLPLLLDGFKILNPWVAFLNRPLIG